MLSKDDAVYEIKAITSGEYPYKCYFHHELTGHYVHPTSIAVSETVSGTFCMPGSIKVFGVGTKETNQEYFL